MALFDTLKKQHYRIEGTRNTITLNSDDAARILNLIEKVERIVNIPVKIEPREVAALRVELNAAYEAVVNDPEPILVKVTWVRIRLTVDNIVAKDIETDFKDRDGLFPGQKIIGFVRLNHYSNGQVKATIEDEA